MAPATKGKPPVFVIPPAPAKKGSATSERSQYDAFIKKHPQLKPYEQAIWDAANTYGGFTPTEVASVLLFEKGYGSNVNKANKEGTGFGLAQINPKVWFGKAFPPTGQIINAAWASNPVNAAQFASWYLHQAYVAGHTDIDSAYGATYNPNFFKQNPGAKGPSQYIAKGYVGAGVTTVESAAQRAAALKGAKQDISDPWMVINAKGQIATVFSATAPKNALKYGGQPITQSGFNQVWKQTYSDTFFAYTGRAAKPKEIQAILAQSPSVYTLGNQLANGPGFANSPVYKKSAPGLVSYARTILGNNWKPSGGIIRQAIAQNWDQATFYAHLKQTPAYLNGPEFKDNLAKNQSAFESIYGNQDQHDPSVAALVKQKTLAGWTPDELQSWLRAQPAYKYTPEYQSKMVSFQQQLGLITGAQATLSAQQIDQMMSAGTGLTPPPKATGAPASSSSPPANPSRPDDRPGPRGP